MEKNIGMCGIDCIECPAYLAKEKKTYEEREKAAQAWSTEYKANITAEMMDCQGCTSKEGPYFFHCNQCEIRLCASEKGYDNCAHCPDYTCEKTKFILDNVPSAKANLEEIRNSL